MAVGASFRWRPVERCERREETLSLTEGEKELADVGAADETLMAEDRGRASSSSRGRVGEGVARSHPAKTSARLRKSSSRSYHAVTIV